MKEFLLNNWDAVMNSQHNPLRHLDLASQHVVMQALGWMWSMVFSLMFFSIFQFGITWMLHLLFISGIALTVSVFKQAEKQQAQADRSLSRSTSANTHNST
jgi:hypothetical protein